MWLSFHHNASLIYGQVQSNSVSEETDQNCHMQDLYLFPLFLEPKY